MVKATANNTMGSCAVAWNTIADSTLLAATPSTIPASDPAVSRVNMRPSATDKICLACAPNATRMLSSRRRLLTVYEARPKVPGNREQKSECTKKTEGDSRDLGREEAQCQRTGPVS